MNEVGGNVTRPAGMRCAYQILLEMICRRRVAQR